MDKDQQRTREQALADQAMANLADTLPPYWKRLYDRCIEVGFSETQAMSILLTMVNASFRQGQ